MPENLVDLKSRRLGACCICGRPLTNSESIESMMGPICSGKYAYLLDQVSVPVNPEEFKTACEKAGLDVNLDEGLNEASNQILRVLSRGMPENLAEHAIDAIAALGYMHLAAVVGSALGVSRWDGASLDKAYVKIETVGDNRDLRITIKNGRISTNFWSTFISQMKAIPGRRWEPNKKINHFPNWPQSAKAVIKLCERWFPFAEIEDGVKELAKQPDIAVNIPEPKAEKTANVEMNSERGIDIYTPKYNSAFNDSLKASVFGWNKGWNKEKRCWWVKEDFIEPAISAVLEYYPNAKFAPELEKLVQEIKEQNQLSTATTINEEGEIHVPGGVLYPFQSVGVRFLELKISTDGGVIIGDDMGLGKTVQALAFLARSISERTPALIVCPANVKLNWARQVMVWIDGDIDCAVVEGNDFHPIGKDGNKIRSSKYPVINIKNNKPRVVITNYDLLKRFKIYFTEYGFQTIILDESHYVKESDSGRSKAAREIAKNIPRRILMTGTPVLNRPRELWHQLHICAPEKWPKFTTFGYKYCNPEERRVYNRKLGKYIFIKQFNGASNLDELHRRVVGQYMIRRKKKDVLKDLPDKTVFRTALDIDKKDREEYDFAVKDFLSWAFEEGGSEKVERVSSAEAITKLTTLKRLCAESKVRAITEYCKEWLDSNEDEQLILFAHHQEVIDKLEDSIKNAGFTYSTIRGGDNSNKRQIAIDRFKSGDARVFIASILAAGTGTDGLQVCQNMKVIERTWRPADMTQAEDRIHRIGQSAPCFVEYLDMEDSIDGKMAAIIAHKLNIIAKIVDGSAGDIGDISKEVLNAMLEEA